MSCVKGCGQGFWAKWDNATPGTAGGALPDCRGKGADKVTIKVRGQLYVQGTLTGTVAFLRCHAANP